MTRVQLKMPELMHINTSKAIQSILLDDLINSVYKFVGNDQQKAKQGMINDIEPYYSKLKKLNKADTIERLSKMSNSELEKYYRKAHVNDFNLLQPMAVKGQDGYLKPWFLFVSTPDRNGDPAKLITEDAKRYTESNGKFQLEKDNPLNNQEYVNTSVGFLVPTMTADNKMATVVRAIEIESTIHKATAKFN